jgi:hypothetical protein
LGEKIGVVYSKYCYLVLDKMDHNISEIAENRDNTWNINPWPPRPRANCRENKPWKNITYKDDHDEGGWDVGGEGRHLTHEVVVGAGHDVPAEHINKASAFFEQNKFFNFVKTL